MSQTLLGHEIKVLPYDICPENLVIVKKVNQHAAATVIAIVPEGQKDKYISMTKTSTPMEIQHQGESGSTCLFKGIVTDIEVKAVRGIYYVRIDGLSNTLNMDLKLRRRSFQNKNMLYKTLIQEVIKDYSGGDFIDVDAKGQKLGKFVIQYDETDWQFLKRMVSHFNGGLVADALSDKPKFWFGVHKGSNKGDLEQYNYSVNKKIADYRFSSQNYIENLDEKDFTYYSVQTDDVLNIGDSVSFQNKSLFVFEATSKIKDGVLINEYTLTSEKGMSQNKIFNENVPGVSVEGKVIEIKEDNIKVHLDIDKEQKKDEAFWFPYSTYYSTEGQTGWYCMPELDDMVKLYFPNSKEEEGVIISSVRRRTKGGDFITDPDIKFFRTKFGKELMFTKDEIMITGKDEEILIRLIEKEGIEIYSNKEIKINADKDIKIESGKDINITAGSKVNIKCKESNIMMDGVTTIKGSKVHTN